MVEALGEMTDDLFGFLTTEADREVGAVYPKAMPVILTQPVQRPIPMVFKADIFGRSNSRSEKVRPTSWVMRKNPLTQTFIGIKAFILTKTAG